ncbi:MULTISPECIES: mechanosensitive ion channel family protein [Cellulophaga]|uniref:Mechanosensing system component YbdG n=1 Tax=Cellulophaga lytica (strain ATCC 23178 / DSM 7489 / JCM 8516 / NBRC 14961 / NCIMB 1423 / VKM B-1433 / Cy l20) TaxID=867900 RepID=F0RBJ4_CELLC|nr:MULTISPECIES: mechanosensitive ion channel domain-containing protein [Cellulophaga]ADY30644.1 MscS Mechanosensitive ion channel [Cellulophaga lytica DSM 7489]AIM61628.1 mechanosensitive ion channel protein MscS [Cellulophaga lytica]APU11523.1 mechanosensitive ion channel protein MscS [Cellulophaga lytica]MDO6853107.1 mechanosensitive ion channel [Cellulophaga lytica]TVZ10043.1 miniconductance mechanosensitive channel [Cellulophaga sp. RHA_52]
MYSLNQVSSLLYNYLVEIGLDDVYAKYLNTLILLLLLIIVLYIFDYVLRKIFISVFAKFTSISKTNFDDFLVKNKVPRNVAHIVPIIIAYNAIPFVFNGFIKAQGIILKGLEVFGIVLTLWVVRSLLNTLKDFFKTLPNLKDKPIDSYIQVFMIFLWSIGILLAISILTDIELWKFLTGLGTASAVILLIFKDTILGFVASIQVSINDMVRIGDWISFDNYGADGDVIEINLATVKVQNFDNTITTIPTYALISDSFKNWRGMTNSPGRRIKRALIIKQESINFLAPKDIQKFKKISLITDYIKSRQESITDFNTSNNIDKSILINGRNLTNIGLFRKYADTYLKNHSAINKDMMVMVRQLAPTPQGIPLEVYAFSSDKRWENYEYIMSDIFDHLLAAIPFFDLELFELPSSSSFKNNTKTSLKA